MCTLIPSWVFVYRILNLLILLSRHIHAFALGHLRVASRVRQRHRLLLLIAVSWHIANDLAVDGWLRGGWTRHAVARAPAGAALVPPIVKLLQREPQPFRTNIDAHGSMRSS